MAKKKLKLVELTKEQNKALDALWYFNDCVEEGFMREGATKAEMKRKNKYLDTIILYIQNHNAKA